LSEETAGDPARGVADVQGGAGTVAPVAAPGRIPEFFIVGNAKSGTTALYQMLKRHPDVYMPDSKEPWFFADELLERTPPRPEGTARTIEEYRLLFAKAGAEQLVGEASPLYLWSRTAAARIAAAQPEARIIALFREPASFLRSLHMQQVETYVETEVDFRKALELEPERREGRRIPAHTYWPKTLLYSEHVRYVENIGRFREHFPADRILPLIYEDFRSDNEATIRQVLRFLGLEAELPIELREVNASVRVRSQRMHAVVHALTVGRGPLTRSLKGAVKAVTPDDMRQRVVRRAKRRLLYSEPLPPDPVLMAELRGTYKPEVEALGKYMNRDLVSLWGYDRVD
jgi:Sulfotransferase family